VCVIETPSCDRADFFAAFEKIMHTAFGTGRHEGNSVMQRINIMFHITMQVWL